MALLNRRLINIFKTADSQKATFNQVMSSVNTKATWCLHVNDSGLTLKPSMWLKEFTSNKHVIQPLWWKLISFFWAVTTNNGYFKTCSVFLFLLNNSLDVKWNSYLRSMTKDAGNRVGSLYHSSKYLALPAIFYLYKFCTDLVVICGCFSYGFQCLLRYLMLTVDI